MTQPQPQASSLPSTGAPNAPSYPHSASPAQQSPSPAQSHPAFSVPAAKRVRMSPTPGSQPQSPYSAVSPGALTPTTASANALRDATSPRMPNASAGLAFPTPANPTAGYSNGGGLPLPVQAQQLNQVPTIAAPQLPLSNGAAPNSLYTTASMAPMTPTAGFSMASPSPATPGTMGPPPMGPPTHRPAREPDYEPDDMLAGTGIDIRAEEQFQADMLYGTEARQGFPLYPPGDKASMYGAGPMNQIPEPVVGMTESEYAVMFAEKTWKDAASALAATRAPEINSPFIGIAQTHARAQRIAKEQGLVLHLDIKRDNSAPQGRMRMPEDQAQPSVRVGTKVLDDGVTVVDTYGSVIPQDSFLVDQLALLSIACKYRVAALLEDALRIADNRQASSHGDIPEEWADVAAAPKAPEEVIEAQQMGGSQQDVEMTVPDSAVSPRTNPLKRPLPTSGPEQVTESSTAKLRRIEKNQPITTMREVGTAERSWEENRLRRRNARAEGTTDQPGTPRADSVAPSTPGVTAAEGGARKESVSKKDQKKTAAAKAIDASMSQASQNQTSSLFLGKSKNLFGKKAKSYNWMSKGQGGRSGASTPARSGTPGPAQAGTGNAPADEVPLTVESRNRLGNWREDKEKGKSIQLRDWISAVSGEGLATVDARTLQTAYDKLDASGPR